MKKKNICFCLLLTVILYMCCYVELQSATDSKKEILYLYKCFYDDDPDVAKHTAKILIENETVGTFKEIIWGDYCHFNIKELNGKENSFFVSQNINWDLFGKFLDDSSYIGKKVKITWHRVNLFIPEANERRVIDVMVRICLIE